LGSSEKSPGREESLCIHLKDDVAFTGFVAGRETNERLEAKSREFKSVKFLMSFLKLKEKKKDVPGSTFIMEFTATNVPTVKQICKGDKP
jgi:hypothetical protein